MRVISRDFDSMNFLGLSVRTLSSTKTGRISHLLVWLEHCVIYCGIKRQAPDYSAVHLPHSVFTASTRRFALGLLVAIFVAGVFYRGGKFVSSRSYICKINN